MSAFDTYRQMRDSGLRNGENARAEEQQNALMGVRQQAGNALSRGDYAGASGALFQGGDLTGGLSVMGANREQQSATRTQQEADRTRQRDAVVRGARGLRYLPPAQRWTAYQTQILPALQREGIDPAVLSGINEQHMTDADLDAVMALSGGDMPDAPSGYRYAAGGALEPIPGGPASAENQRWQVTPYGLLPPPGWQPPAQGAPGGAPQYVDELPPGVRPRPNQPASGQPVRATSEMSQPSRVSYRDTGQARSAISQIVPGVNFTSGVRTAEHNRAVGGVPTSNHVRGRAWDLTPPSGMSMSQLAQKMRSEGFRVLDEGDHVHVSW